MSSNTKVYEEKMKSSVEHLGRELAAVRAGRANPAVLDKVTVDYYGAPTPIQQVASVAVSEARTLYAPALRVEARSTVGAGDAMVGGMLLALLFNRMTRSFNVMRSIAFMPKYIAVSTSAVVFMWILYSPAATGANQSEGILNYALSLFGITGPHWLIDSATALTGILFLTAWRVVGYAMMIYLSAMKGIPQDYYEAAVIDGADGVQRFRYITVPLLAPTSLFLFVTTFIASMKVFQSVDVMTGGGPGTATNVMVQWIYNLTFKDFRTARGAAVSLVFFMILLVCTVATMRFSNKNVNYAA